MELSNPFSLKKIPDKALIGIDIGGSLTKVCIIFNKSEKELYNFLLETKRFEFIEANDTYLCLTRFLTTNFQSEILPLFKDLQKHIKVTQVEATGGGAYKFSDIMRDSFGINFNKHDELKSLVAGYVYLNQFSPFYKLKGKSEIIKMEPKMLTYPHISVNIGSGVSILKVDSHNKIERVGGTILGGGALIGLSKILFGIDSYNAILELASKGNYENVDLTIGDIYKNFEKKSNLPDYAISSSLGKIFEKMNSDNKENIKNEDIAVSLLMLICSHISFLGDFYAGKFGIKQIFYFGNFARRGSKAIYALQRCHMFWDKDKFIGYNYYDGYLGSVGALVEEVGSS